MDVVWAVVAVLATVGILVLQIKSWRLFHRRLGDRKTSRNCRTCPSRFAVYSRQACDTCAFYKRMYDPRPWKRR